MRRRTAWVLGGAGLALAIVLVALARPATIVALVRGSQPGGIALAFAGAAAVWALRGLRLALVAGRALPAARATAVMGVVNVAAAALPLRAGDLSLIPLLRATGLPGTIRGLSLLVALRLLDVTGLLIWVAVAAALLGGRYGWAALPLAAIPVCALVAVAVGLRWLRSAATRWRRRRGWRRRVLGQLLQVRRELREAARSPVRSSGAVLISVAIWGGIWAYTLALVRAMGLGWAPSVVLVGLLGAAVGAALPVNVLGNFGTLEAGWTAALVAVGVPGADALASGFATHAWNVLFIVVLGAASAAYLALSQPGIVARQRRPERKASSSSGDDA